MIEGNARGLMAEELILLERMINCAPLPGGLSRAKQEAWDKALAWQRNKAAEAVQRWVQQLEETGNDLDKLIE